MAPAANWGVGSLDAFPNPVALVALATNSRPTIETA
jgi:hypothetical protein